MSTAAEAHQSGQAALVSLVPAAVDAAWPLLDPHDIAGTSERLTVAVQAIVHRYGQAAAAAALQFYRSRRLAAGVTGRGPSLTVAEPPALAVVARNVQYGLSGLYGPVTDAVEADARAQVAESASRLVLDQGRATLIDATVQDKAAKGWARVVEPGGCAFCTMLALRAGAGLLYRSKRGAEFRAHDNCRCHVEPVFTAYEPSYRMREMQSLWAASTRGKGGKDALNAFRTALANRPQDA